VTSGEACILLQGRRQKAMTDQLTTVSKLRLIRKAGSISSDDMEMIEHAIKTQLGLGE